MMQIIYYGLFFFFGIASTLLFQRAIHSEETVVLQRKDVLWARGSFWGSLALVLFGFFYLLGPGGWVYNDFTYYQSQVVCYPKEWNANLYPMQGNFQDYIKIREGNVSKTWEAGGMGNLSFNISELMRQTPPYKPEG